MEFSTSKESRESFLFVYLSTDIASICSCSFASHKIQSAVLVRFLEIQEVVLWHMAWHSLTEEACDGHCEQCFQLGPL